jgi:D-cysteine desulfhydrase
MNLAKFPRRRYTSGQTPLEKLSRVTALLGGPNIYIKRDDLLGLTSGGNKTRKLEFLVAEALAGGADTLITAGAVQSNHCRLTLSAANKEGLKCRLVLEERVAKSYKPDASGNNFLFHLLGVEQVQVVPAGSDLMASMHVIANELASEHRKAYIIPVGGSNPVGTVGYVACAEEIAAQAFEQGVNLDCVITASGSGGTHAGLVVGFVANNTNIPVLGINVSRQKKPQETLVYDLAQATAVRVGVKNALVRDSVQCLDDYVGAGYSVPTPEMAKAVKFLAQTEGILLDPVYTGKAMAGILDLIHQGFFVKGQNILFVHTGGAPALYAYMSVFR